ncbi:MAG TPA: hypothetical protein VFZ48_01195 [Candidatus Saccharimonadales bacterium]
MVLRHYFAADNYSCDAYGQSAYGQCATQGTTPPSQTPGGGLGNTGYEIILPLALGAALIVAGMILLAKKLRRRNS